MQIAPALTAGATPITAAAAKPAFPTPSSEAPWKNPAAASALRSTVQLLRAVEDGLVKSYGEAERARIFAPDLRMTNDILTSAADALRGDASKDNDLFLPQIDIAGSGVMQAETRLASKDLAATWPSERVDILAAVRKARVIAANVADQLDPNAMSSALRGAHELPIA